VSGAAIFNAIKIGFGVPSMARRDTCAFAVEPADATDRSFSSLMFAASFVRGC
jgi:hypothetical protein